MVEHHDDEGLHRLRASDPATGSHPDLSRLRALVEHKAPASRGAGADRATQVDDLLRDPVIRAPWVAAACIAALAIGAGGYALGAQRGPGTLLVAGEDSLLGAAGAGMEPGLSAEMAGSAYASSGSSVESAPEPYDPGPVRLVAGPALSQETTTAPISVLRSDEDPEAFLAAWAEALGMDGVPMEVDADFLPEGDVGLAEAETGRMIMASTDGGGLYVSYSDFYSSPDCREGITAVSGQEREMLTEYWEATFGEGTPLPTAEDCHELTGERPTKEQARGAAQDFLDRAGIPTEGFDFRVDDEEYGYGDGFPVVYVEAAPPGGAYGPRHVHLTVGPEGVIDAGAGLGEMVAIGDYPVISPAQAVERYGEKEFTEEYGVQLPEDLEDTAPSATGTTGTTFVAPELPDPPEVEDGMALPLLLKDKEVTGAELVRGSIYTHAGTMEVPVWELSTDDGMTYTVMAVADEAIDWISWG
ncbi:hypothetical protein SGUI_2836 [Serinicoccus hydrothermalis]|uniref:Uncharacterized protein n=1 Tax=Serinicoccus hydrothermalis TaxID=1758689 RepID=A0A1B1NFN4_9MICO|nr:hypothetical protein [Serinicoccus hydrothermalis]ANS80232.1 hypothetical protein SGUI_2836 [Serinicoccus hydrothermalis]